MLPLRSLSNAAAALKRRNRRRRIAAGSTARPLMRSGGAKFLGWVGDGSAAPTGCGVRFAEDTDDRRAGMTKACCALAAPSDREYRRGLSAVKDGKADINEKTKPLLDIITKTTPICRSSRSSAITSHRSGRQAGCRERRQPDQLAQEQGFVDKGICSGCDHREGLCEGGLISVRRHGGTSARRRASRFSPGMAS